MATLHNYTTLTTWLKLWQEVVFDILEIVISTWNQGVTEQAQAEAINMKSLILLIKETLPTAM